MSNQLDDTALTELLEVAETARMNASRCRCRPDCDPCASTGFNQKFNHVACIALVKELIERREECKRLQREIDAEFERQAGAGL